MFYNSTWLDFADLTASKHANGYKEWKFNMTMQNVCTQKKGGGQALFQSDMKQEKSQTGINENALIYLVVVGVCRMRHAQYSTHPNLNQISEC